ncbi:uncharacterized protein LOC110739472 [Chenopodium quinoa]|uniref:uncharacterized protein LOC110739472 n=1 Tax=Chenopodium quinoa TaxID=63459 RepID=UPI000B772C26|nr:uncharacterized protein LOC110739472 [Chenopodium quinoa]XP_021775610.1 uncharacterized protein LOC110739472 [Chenopodium quinoa]XP_021775612.1 uncharacterized protein LOC110739472 [Chenopodium quinoa]
MVPSYTTLKHVQRDKVNLILSKYGKTRKNREEHGMYESVGIPVYPEFMERLEWEEHEEEEFKTLFLLLALEMLLCPALSSRLATDLVPALTCSVDSVQYDWCTLVMSKLLQSVRSFARQFYSYGHAGGWGGCILFAVVFYLDRLDREAVDWGNFPRLKVWIMKEISLASKEDKSLMGGDYGCAGTLDVAYGETNPRQARDTDGPGVETQARVTENEGTEQHHQSFPIPKLTRAREWFVVTSNYIWKKWFQVCPWAKLHLGMMLHVVK